MIIESILIKCFGYLSSIAHSKVESTDYIIYYSDACSMQHLLTEVLKAPLELLMWKTLNMYASIILDHSMLNRFVFLHRQNYRKPKKQEKLFLLLILTRIHLSGITRNVATLRNFCINIHVSSVLRLEGNQQLLEGMEVRHISPF